MPKTIFQRCGALIRKIEVTLDKGKRAEQNLTALRDIVHAELVKETREREKTGLTLRLNEIEKLLTELHDRNTNSEVRFRTFMRQMSAGAIRSPSYAHSVLENLHRTYTLEVDAHLTAVRNVLGDAVAFLKSAVRNSGMLLGELARIKLNFLTGLFRPPRRASDLHFLG
ncbi:male-specific Is5 protein, putative [Ixodes scapularis]|uniref:Male-specific Is5 protein, putative n=1 Tax=Ixodes scapularis TaxID=6945 RepID=B7PQ00_IXOSC|nr:male-specific Is5 protein, putative [Ixodes scapularis]|eukprot:XP_002435842.1 male-specific Is5 protein, putative [Ixodes scapularis]